MRLAYDASSPSAPGVKVRWIVSELFTSKNRAFVVALLVHAGLSFGLSQPLCHGFPISTGSNCHILDCWWLVTVVGLSDHLSSAPMTTERVHDVLTERAQRQPQVLLLLA